MIRLRADKSSRNTERDLERMIRGDHFKGLDNFGRLGVEALRSVTPVDTGATAAAWDYRIERSPGNVTIEWINTNNAAGRPIVLMLHYGHGTGTGGYVAGRDFINPAIRPVFDKIAQDVWRRVING